MRCYMGDYVHVIILTICGFWCIINKNISYNTIRFSFFNEKILFAIVFASLIWCVIKMIDIFSLWGSSFIVLPIPTRDDSSRAENGSSNNIMLGARANALAIAIRCFCPPDSCDGYFLYSSNESIPTLLSFSLAIFCASLYLLLHDSNCGIITFPSAVSHGNSCSVVCDSKRMSLDGFWIGTPSYKHCLYQQEASYMFL